MLLVLEAIIEIMVVIAKVMTGYDVKKALAHQAFVVRSNGDRELAGFLEYLADAVDMNAKALGSAASDTAMKEVLLNTLEFERNWKSPEIIAGASEIANKLFAGV